VRGIRLEQTHKIAWEHVPTSLSSNLVKQLSTPPPVLWGISHGNNIARLEIKFFVNGCCVIIQRFHYEYKLRQKHTKVHFQVVKHTIKQDRTAVIGIGTCGRWWMTWELWRRCACHGGAWRPVGIGIVTIVWLLRVLVIDGTLVWVSRN
jgi:hypothetical protein